MVILVRASCGACSCSHCVGGCTRSARANQVALLSFHAHRVLLDKVRCSTSIVRRRLSNVDTMKDSHVTDAMKTYILPYKDLNPQPLGLCVTPLSIRISHVMYNHNNYIISY